MKIHKDWNRQSSISKEYYNGSHEIYIRVESTKNFELILIENEIIHKIE